MTFQPGTTRSEERASLTVIVTLLLGVNLGGSNQAPREELGPRKERSQERKHPAEAPTPLAPARPPSARRINYKGHTYDTYELDLTRARPRFFFKRPDGTPFSSLGNLRDWLRSRWQRLVFATNAGMFTPAHMPVGLYVEEGRMLVDLNTGEDSGNFFLKPNAVFFVMETQAGILESMEYKARPPRRCCMPRNQGRPCCSMDGCTPPFARGPRTSSSAAAAWASSPPTSSCSPSPTTR